MKNKFEHGDRVDFLKDDNYLNGAVISVYVDTDCALSFVYNVRFSNFEPDNDRPFIYKLCREHELILINK